MNNTPCFFSARPRYARSISTAVILLTFAVVLHAAGGHNSASPAATPPHQALASLEAGNARFVSGSATHPNQGIDRLAAVAPVQRPIAVIVSCSDSRVPPEIVFDQGLGDLFVVRCAGNVVSSEDLGSIEYAVDHLAVRLIVVLGHQRCGAVAAAVQSDHAPGHIDALVKAIHPAVVAVRGKPGDLLDNAVKANVRRVVAQIAKSGPILEPRVHSGEIEVVGAYYSLDTGRATLLK